MCPDIPSLIVVYIPHVAYNALPVIGVIKMRIITSPWGIVYVRLYLFVTFSAMISWDNDYSYCRR